MQQKCAILVELEKCCKIHTSIYLQNLASIQPRTSPPKICKILHKLQICQFCQTQAGFDQLSGVAQMFVQAPSDVPLSRAQLRHVLRGTLVALYEVFKFVKLLLLVATILQNVWCTKRMP